MLEIYFTDYFKVTKNILDKYGAFNISLILDLPLFIDPFLLFNSSKKEYQKLHEDIIEYLKFLKNKSVYSNLSSDLINSWYTFPEVRQNWFGYSSIENRGRGLGSGFAKNLNNNLHLIFSDFGEKTKITRGNHIEKLYILNKGVGKDRISDFTTNLIKKYLLEYTQNFARKYLYPDFIAKINVPKVEFNYHTETWAAKQYELPIFENDYVILTPKDILTKDDTWINSKDLLKDFQDTIDAIPNMQLRALVNNYFKKILPENPTRKDKNDAKVKTLQKYQELIDYYIKYKEDTGEIALINSQKKVNYSNKIFVDNAKKYLELFYKNSSFTSIQPDSFKETLDRVKYFKEIIENNDGYKIFYFNNKPIANENDIQILFRFVWYASKFDVNREPNNGRGPVDYKISFGNADKTILEFKLARNSALKRNLQNQLKIYEQSNKTDKSITIIVYFNNDEYIRVVKILKELKLENNENYILIDACVKESASKV